MNIKNIIKCLVIIILAIILGIIVKLYIDTSNSNNNSVTDNNFPGRFPMEENKTKETTAEDVDEGETVNSKEIDLSKYDTNLTISEEGTYTLSGSFTNSVIVNASGEVTIILDGVNIESSMTSAITNATTNPLTIVLAENSTNNLSDGGSSEYDGCIFSYGELTIEGKGTLNVNGKQDDGEGIATKSANLIINSGTINVTSQDDGLNTGGSGGSIIINGGKIFIKANGDGIDSNGLLTINGGNVYTIGSSIGGDAGIDTDEGFVFNGGEVIALGSDMLEKAESNSKQKSAYFELNSKISSGSKIEVKNENGDVVASFEAKEDFKTLIISNDDIKDEVYSLYVNGEKVDL